MRPRDEHILKFQVNTTKPTQMVICLLFFYVNKYSNENKCKI